jgi:hypothetical protein
MENVEDDILGVSMVVSSKSGSGGGGTWKNIAGEEIKIIPDEWYPAVLSKIEPSVHVTYGDQFLWFYDLEGVQFTVKNKEGKEMQFRARKTTSRAHGPKSVLYKIVCKLMGVDSIPEGGTIPPLRNFIGTPVDVMINVKKYKNSEGEDRVYYEVEKVRLRVSKPVPPENRQLAEGQHPPKPVVAPTAPPVAVKPVVAQTTTPVASTGDVFEDIQ